MVNAWWSDNWADNVNVSKPLLRASLRDFVPLCVSSTSQLNAIATFGQAFVYIAGATYALDPADTTSANAPPAVVVSLSGDRYKPLWGLGREVLNASRTYYVRADGSDANTGLADNAGGAFLTLQKAANVAAALDTSIYNVTVQVRSGTFAPFTPAQPAGGGLLTFQGDNATPANVTISGSGMHCINANGLKNIAFRGFKLTTTAGGNGINVINSAVDIYEVEYGACVWAQEYINNNSIVRQLGARKISGGAQWHIQCEDGGRVAGSSLAVTLTGTPAYSLAYAYAARGSGIFVPFYTYTGSATGPKYSAVNSSSIQTFGGTLPGSTAGSVDGTSSYA